MGNTAERIVMASVLAFYGYGTIGFLFAIAFVSRGVQKVDRQAAGTSIAFRLLIFPGAVAFWPFLLRRWLGATVQPPEERNPDR